MPREDWMTLVGTLGQPVSFDVRATPLQGVTHASSVVASIAHQFGSATATVGIFRYDPADVPTPINQDEYDVWKDLSAHPRLSQMINAASTSDNENFRTYCRDNVFFVKRRPGPDHWLPTLPSTIVALVRSSSE